MALSFKDKNSFATFMFNSSPDISKYQMKIRIGHGAHGEIFKGVNLEDGQEVAIKKYRVENKPDGFPMAAMREIGILRDIRVENIINFYEVCTSKPSPENNIPAAVYLILEFCEHDLAGLLAEKTVYFTLSEKKQILLQLFKGINFLHTNQIMHRDLKPANILLTKNGVLKLADFSSAKRFLEIGPNDPPQIFANRVVTFWYRAPELLLGNKSYGPTIDLWAAGCIMGELWTRQPILMGKNVMGETDNDKRLQMTAILKLCGSITPEVRSGLEDFSIYTAMDLPTDRARQVIKQFQPLMKDDLGCDLLDKLLVVNHKERLDAAGALNHEFFKSEPLPYDLSCTLSQHNTSMFTYGKINW